MTEILVVDDEPAILDSVEYALKKMGHIVRTAGSLKQAKQQLAETTGLIILDLMLPDGSGFDWIDELSERRKRGLALIVLSSRDTETDRVRALEIGADDYVTKPFSPREVAARVTAVMRRLEPPQISDGQLAIRLTINPQTRRAWVDQHQLDLTRVEFDLLQVLHQSPGHVYSRATIINEVWGAGFALSDRTIDSHIKALRKKITEAGGMADWIETVRGIGYRLAQGESLP